MQRLSALDASFLHVETPTAHMHVGWVSMLDLPAGANRLDTGALGRRIADRLHLAPRFRQRIVQPPLSLGEPYWQDDERFDLDGHVVVGSGRPRGPGGVQGIAADFFSEPLSRDRPLWKILVLPRVGVGRAAILGKIHHAMVDGIAAVELGMLLFDLAPEGVAIEPVDWEPTPASGPVRLVIDAVGDSALEQFRAARRIASLGLAPGRGMRLADSMRKAALSLAEDALRPAPESYLNVPIGPRRVLIGHGVRLDRLMRIKRRTGTSLNDVVLAVVAGALRRLALARGAAANDVRVMVPVSVRADEDSTSQGNRITFAFVDLPVGDPNARRQLSTINARTRELKESGRVAGSDMMLRSLGALPGPLKVSAARLAASPRLYNLTVSNVPGPRTPLYAVGARVRSILPLIPMPDRHALAIGALTYDGHAYFSAYADPNALPGVNRLPLMLEDASQELDLLTGAPGQPVRPKRADFGRRAIGDRRPVAEHGGHENRRDIHG